MLTFRYYVKDFGKLLGMSSIALEIMLDFPGAFQKGSNFVTLSLQSQINRKLSRLKRFQSLALQKTKREKQLLKQIILACKLLLLGCKQLTFLSSTEQPLRSVKSFWVGAFFSEQYRLECSNQIYLQVFAFEASVRRGLEMMSNAFLRFFFFLFYSNAVFTFQGSRFQLLLIMMIVEALDCLRHTGANLNFLGTNN